MTPNALAQPHAFRFPHPPLAHLPETPPRIDATFMNPRFMASLDSLDQRLPTGTLDFFFKQAYFYVHKNAQGMHSRFIAKAWKR
jgi:hypothetical protein